MSVPLIEYYLKGAEVFVLLTLKRMHPRIDILRIKELAMQCSNKPSKPLDREYTVKNNINY